LPAVDADEPSRGTTPPARRYLGVPLWGWVVIIAIVVGVLLLLADLSNRNRYVLVCKARTVELHQGQRFPWPFGEEPIGGPEYKPFAVADADCRTREFRSEEEASLSFLELLLTQVRGALANPAAANLKEARNQLQQALLLARTHPGRRKEAQHMLADLSYREGRSGLVRAESELRVALSRFQETQKLDAGRFDDLDQWIAHVEELLRSISPSPFSRTPGLSGGRLPDRPPGSQPRPLPSSRPSLPPDRSAPPDGGPPPSSGGILM
jgi:hypothetical protein